MNDVETILREVLAARAGTVAPPVETYPAVRRRVRHRRQAIAGTVAAIAVAAVVVPTLDLRDRPDPPVAAPTAVPTGCPISYPGTTAAAAAPGLVPQHDVRGSLAGDAAVVDAVLRTGWATLVEDGTGGLLAGTARVVLAERAGGQIVGVVTARVGTRIEQAYVVGPDAARLRGQDGGSSAFLPQSDPLVEGDLLVGTVDVCDVPQLVVVAPPGTTGTLTWVTRIGARLTVDRSVADVPLRADGAAVYAPPAPQATLRLERAGRLMAEERLPLGVRSGDPDAEEVRRAVAAAPGDGDPDLAGGIVSHQPDALPVAQSDLRVLWTGRTRGGITVAVAVTTLPGGAQYVWAGSGKGAGATQEDWSGLLPAGALSRTVLAWRLTGHPKVLAVVAVGSGVRSYSTSTDTTSFTEFDTGALIEDGAGIGSVSVYAAGPRLIGTQVPGEGLTPVPS